MIKNRSLTLQQFQLEKTTFDRWLAQYHHHDINGLEVRGKKQVYSVEFKLSVIQACLRFRIENSSVISQWLHTFDKQGINGLYPKPKGRPTMKAKYPKMPRLPKRKKNAYVIAF